MRCQFLIEETQWKQQLRDKGKKGEGARKRNSDKEQQNKYQFA